MSQHLLLMGGSLRAGSLALGVLRAADAIATELGASTSTFETSRLTSGLFRPDAPLPADARELGEEVRRADALLVVTPVYGGTPSGAVMNLLDVLHAFKQGRRGPLEGKRVGVGAVGGGALDGRYAFQPAATTTLAVACRQLGGWVHPHHVELSELVFGPDGTLDDPLALDDVRRAVTALVHRRGGPGGEPSPRQAALSGEARR